MTKPLHIPKYTALAILVSLLSAVTLAACSASTKPSQSRQDVPSSLFKSSNLSGIDWPKGPLSTSGRFIVDSTGRVIILHGVNEVYKVPPYCPQDTAWGIEPADASLMHNLGFDVVRLGYLWEGFEPQKGKFDYNYLNCLQRTESMLANQHIFTLVDSHQDLYTQKFGGEGFPQWAVHNHHLSLSVNRPFPGNQLSRAVTAAFDGLWENRGNVWQSYAQAWGKVAAYFKNDPMVLGYDIMNEPWPAKFIGSPVTFDTEYLEPFETMSAQAIRSNDPHHIIFYEPPVTFNGGVPSSFTPPSPSLDPVGFSFHNYCLTHGEFSNPYTAARLSLCYEQFNHVDSNALSAYSSMGAAPLMTEFGATFYTPEISKDIQLTSQDMVGWIYWQFKASGDITTRSYASDHGKCPKNSPESLFRDDCIITSLHRKKATALSQPYPAAIAGVPTSYGYNPSTGIFHLSYSVTRKIAAPTLVYTSVALHYPHGYLVHVVGATTKGSSKRTTCSNWLEFHNLADATSVTVTLTPSHDNKTCS